MRHFKTLSLIAAMAATAAPAWADLAYTGTGAYNLGSASGPGGTAASTTPCGVIAGQDALTFTSAGANSIGIHAYSCDSDFSDFGSRSSGVNTYYAQGIASIIGTKSLSDIGDFSFQINAGQVGAFGSTAFAFDEFQKAKLTIKLTIDGTVYMDEAWSAEVGENGVITNSYTHNGSLSVGFTSTGGAGYFSYGINGGFYSIDLTDGDHDISYVMTSEASGNIVNTATCTAVLYGGPVGDARGQNGVTANDGQGPNPFPAYCGAGAQSGDPFSPPIAVALPPNDLPEPMTAGLTLTALLAAVAARRRTR